MLYKLQRQRESLSQQLSSGKCSTMEMYAALCAKIEAFQYFEDLLKQAIAGEEQEDD